MKSIVVCGVLSHWKQYHYAPERWFLQRVCGDVQSYAARIELISRYFCVAVCTHFDPKECDQGRFMDAPNYEAEFATIQEAENYVLTTLVARGFVDPLHFLIGE